jgi:hypothetical protein
MAFKLEEDEKKGVLQLNYNGVIDKITLWNARSKLASMVEKTGIKNVFVDMNINFPVPITNICQEGR